VDSRGLPPPLEQPLLISWMRAITTCIRLCHRPIGFKLLSSSLRKFSSEKVIYYALINYYKKKSLAVIPTYALIPIACKCKSKRILKGLMKRVLYENIVINLII